MIPKVSIIILNWNGKRFLKKCLDSVFNQTYKRFDVILVDNNSIDDSINFVRKKYKKYILSSELKIIVNKKNYGFAMGNNIGIKKALEDSKIKYINFINVDMILDKSWLTEMVKIAESNKKIGICQGKLLQMRDKNKIDGTGILLYKSFTWWSRGQDEIDYRQYDKDIYIFGSCSASLYRRELIEELMLNDEFFDNDFFLTCEDIDISIRARLYDWEIKYVPTSIAYHYGSASVGKTSPTSIYYSHRNNFWLIIKDIPFVFILKNFPFIFITQTLGILIFALRRQLKPFLNAKIDAIKGIKNMLKKRRIIMKNIKISEKKFESLIEKKILPSHLYPFRYLTKCK